MMTNTFRAWSRVACVMFLFGFASDAAGNAQPGQAPIRDEANAIVIENEFARLTIGKDGATRSLQDVRSSTEYLDTRFPVYFMSARRGNVEFGSSEISRRGNDLDVKFGGSGVHASVRVGVEKGYFTFEVRSVTETNLDELILVDLPLTISERVARVQVRNEHSETINICRNDRFGVCVSSVNLIAHSRTTRYEPAAFRASCYPRFGTVGAKVALLAGPSERMLDLIGQMEVEQGLPHRTLGGEWSKKSREIQKSYLFVDFTEANIDRVIELAKAGGFSYILNYSGTWSKSDGKYEVNTANFPNGLPGLKAVMDKMHAAGLKGGAHILAGGIDKNNAYVTPVPDPRLAKDDMRILASEVGISETTLPLTTSPEGLPAVETYSASGKSLVIDDEVITYERLRTEPPFALEGCTRGAYGTRPAPHRAGSRVYHLAQKWGLFDVNADSDLLEEVAQNVADVINTCGFDQLYFDGLDGVEVNGPFFYYVGKLVQETTKRFNRDVIVQGSNLPHIAWHDFSRLYTIDVNLTAPQKRWVDYHCSQRLTNALYNLIPAELGWFGYSLDSPRAESTTPDVVEYVLAKTAGWSVPWSLETRTAVLEGHGRTRETLALSKIYEELRLRDYFPDSVRKVLRTPKQDFKLVQAGPDKWEMHPINYGPEQLLALRGKTARQFTYENRFREQPLKFRIKARPAPGDFGDKSNRVLMDPEQAGEGTASSASSEFAVTGGRAREQVKTGRTSLKLSGTNRSSRRDSWAAQTFQLTGRWDSTEDRAIGFWVHGDASGAKLHVRFDDGDRLRSRSHFIVLDFSGWKYWEIANPSIDLVVNYPQIMPGEVELELNPGFDPRTSLKAVPYNKVGFLTLLLTDVPENKMATCYVSRVEVLKELPTTLINPTLVLDGNAVRLPVTLENNQYVEYWGEKEATLYDKNGFTLRQLTLNGAPPIRSGANRVQVSHEAPSGDRREVRVELITMGDAIP